jgi:starch phosphorylase
LWEKTHHNPISVLGLIDQKRLEEVCADDSFLAHMERVEGLLNDYLSAQTWFQQTHPEVAGLRIAYFSAEFGLHESIRMYAGGLGVLAGEHFKSASDLGLPMVAVGFLYTRGYFSQHITEDGWQEARNVRLQFDELPVMPIVDEDGQPLTISVNLPGRTVLSRLWEI